MHGGHITWQYWLRRARDAEVYSNERRSDADNGSEASSSHSSRPTSGGRSVDHAEKGGKQAQKRLPCRISIKVSGVEAFMYNRSPAYDGIIDAIQRKANGSSKPEKSSADEDSEHVKNGSVGSSADIHQEGHHHNKLRKTHDSEGNDAARVATSQSAQQPKTKKDDLPAFLRLLPIRVECNKGAIVIGNEHTASVITAQFEKASGEFDAAHSGPLDVYQQVFNFQFTHPVVHMKPNPDFKAFQLETAARLKQEIHESIPDTDGDEKLEEPKKVKRRWGSSLPRLSGLFSKSTDSIHTHPRSSAGKTKKSLAPQIQYPGQERWKGLTRYLDDNQNAGHGEWDAVEYGTSSLIADCPCINVSFYWDVMGPVPSELENSLHVSPEHAADINGSVPPEYGVDIQVYGGTINYGPWADRHRAVFQSIFFPASHVDTVPAIPLTTGDMRVLSIFKLYLSIEDDTVLRIPVREPSKNWKWKGKAHTLAGHDKSAGDKSKGKAKSRRKSMRSKRKDANASGANVRPFGWIDVKVAGNSSVNYIMDMVASKNGFSNRLDVDIVNTEISSSVNHGLLWRSGAISLDCDLSAPLGWNALRKWVFNIHCRELELFLLRDHLFLLTDLVADWGSGPPSDYFNFVPFQYSLNIDFVDFKLYLNTNDSNIVNNPSDLDDNNFIILYGQRLHGDVHIPLDQFKPLHNEIRFDVRGQNLGLEVCMPSKNTLRTFVQSKKVANLGGLTLTGSHTYVTETSAMNTDRLFMDIQGTSLSLELYGWLVHHFIKIKDNYFGEDMHFKTLEEYQGLPSQSLATDATTPNGQPVKVSNDLDVILCIAAEQASILLPSNLYSSENSLRADLPYATADLRFTNYYMDLMVDFSPISISLGTEMTSPGLRHDSSGRTEMFVESVTIFGHRLFGLPPTEPTYVCNWDFEVGKVSGECTSEFIEKATGAARSFAFTLDDDENTLPVEDPLVIHDSTFLRLKTQEIHLWFHIASEAVLVSTGPISLDFNDLAGLMFSQCLNARVPDLTIGAVDAKSASRHRTRAFEKQVVETHAFLETSVSLTMFKRKLGFTEERDKQQAHMQEHDLRTNRTQFMFINPLSESSDKHAKHQEHLHQPAMTFPEIPHAVFFVRPRSIKNGSSISSGFYSDAQSSRGGRHRTSQPRSVSTGSFTRSIRSTRHYHPNSNTAESSRSRTLLGRSLSRTDSAERTYRMPSEDEIKRRNLPPTSVALSSSLAMPYFPLDQIAPDLSDVPSFPALPSIIEEDGDEAMAFNDVVANALDEGFEHTSLIISSEPGIRLYCTPQAIRCVSKLVDLIQPHRPEDLLDAFQVHVMTQILDFQKRVEGKGKSLDFSIRIPFIHTRFQNEYGPYPGMEGGKDQYDIILNRLKVAARIKQHPGDHAGENTFSLHTMLDSLGVSITERTPDGPSDDVAVQAEIRDLLVWMLKSKETSINLTFRTFEGATASRKVMYLASLIHRTTLLGNELVSNFERVGEEHQVRLRYLAWYLTTIQERFSDPVFLTKASYALRAAKDHLRGHDSWKIISRFRYIWQCLPDSEKAEIFANCSQQPNRCPEDAEEKIIRMWDQWRTWDLAHVKKSLAMRTLFGNPPEEGLAAVAAPLYMDIRSHSFKLIVDPGPNQSEVFLRNLAVNVAMVPPPEPTGLMLVGTDIPKKRTIVQFNSKESTLTLRWEICELVEILMKMFQEDSVKKPKHAQPLPVPMPHQKTEDHEFQFIYVAEKAEVSLETINLRSISTGRRFQLSLVGSDNKASHEGETITVLVHLDQGIMQLRSRTRALLRSQFDHPSLYFAHHKYDQDVSIPNKIKVAGASHMIKLEVEDDILGFIEVIDFVIRDEVAYLHKQASTFQQSIKQTPKRVDSEPSTSQLPNITLALFMDAYQIDLKLLQSLSWSIAGSSGRISVVPTLGHDVTLRVDYDLASHTHRMLSSSVKGSNVISSLELPPVNGRLTVTNTDNETRISASGIIETIHLEASEIQALIATINKPEISNVVHAIQDDVDILKTHIEEIFPPDVHHPVVEAPKSSRDIVFDVRMTLSGLDIVASAPGQHRDSPTANLAVRLASIQLKATNVGPDKTRLLLPEAVVHFHKISVEMTLSDSETIRRCGNLTFGATLQATAQKESEPNRRVYRLLSSRLEVNIFADTASAVVDVMNHMQDKIKDLDLSKERKYLRRLRHTKSRISHKRVKSEAPSDSESLDSGELFTSTYLLDLNDIQVSWIVGTSVPPYPRTESEDLVLSFSSINFSTKKGDTARLTIGDMQLQMVPLSADKKLRSLNSALLPEVVFYVAYSSSKDTRKIAFQAAGKSLDLRLDSRFILPANIIERSIALAGKKFQAASANWNMTPTTSGAQRKNPFGNKRLASLLVDATFAGAVVHINGRDVIKTLGEKQSRSQQKGRYSQFVGDGSKSSMALRAPGVALKVEYKDDGHDPSLNAELRIDGSNNILYPTVVPLLIDISDSIKEVVREKDEKSPNTEQAPEPPKPPGKLLEEENIITADPSALLGRTRLNLGLRICKQEFSLSCEPIARVTAVAKLEDIYVTINSVKSQDHGHFFAASAAFQKLEATVQHVYSRESTFGFDVESVVLSLMNSRHLSGTSGISAILKINPMGLQINARQLQDFLLFREIWLPPEIRQRSQPPTAPTSQEPQEYLMQRYQQVTAATAFPWNANVAIADISVELDLGQAIGKTSLHVHNLWASSKKGTDWEQNLCIGVEKIGLNSTGRTSGFVELDGVKVRTSISWPSQELGIRQAPLVQASLGLRSLRVRAGFDYQAFMIADIANFDFLMYNVRELQKGAPDRLVAILDGDKAHVFCTATSAAQGLALYQAIERLVQENQQAYKQSLKDIEKFLRRKSSVPTPYARSASQSMILPKPDVVTKTPLSLHTDVVATLRSINLGVYPSTFVDSQIFSLEAGDVQARFAVALEQGKIHSGLGMTLGKLSVALSNIPSPKRTKPASDLTVEDVTASARSARGGTILRVPKVIATMHTWQVPGSEKIDYIFKSSLEGKVDVGWNYSRISFIRTMWSNHSRSLASRLGKPLPESNIKITSSAQGPATSDSKTSTTDKEKDIAAPEGSSNQQEKITAEVKVPESKYIYTALEPPLIETPQLRDMGEATPPLEWIGLHRDRLPNVTHQIVIVTLLEVAREVEEAYERILGSS